MDIADSGEFSRRLVMLGELFEANLTPAKQALYFEALRDLPFPVVARALNDAVRQCRFMPKPAEVRTLACGDNEDHAEVAWLALRRAMAGAGAYASIVTDDVALADTIVAMFGSWPKACAAEFTAEMWAAKRKEFGRIYRVYRDRAAVGPGYLPGLTEQQNQGIAAWEKFIDVCLVGGLTPPRRFSAEERRQLAPEVPRELSGQAR